MNEPRMRPILIGVLSALFFAVTFVLNRRMELEGGSWLWSSSLRYFFMLPILIAIVAARRRLRSLLLVMRENPWEWLLWSTIGFGLFYAPICLAAAYSPGWVVAGTWQLTIISGVLLAPFFWQVIETPEGPRKIRNKIPVKGLVMSLLILVGVLLMQLEHAGSVSARAILLGIMPILIATFAYPLGNRKMMELCNGRLDVTQRVLGMTLASMPFWILLGGIGLYTAGVPQVSQLTQSFIVAVSSGVIATLLFFYATDLVRGSSARLAGVEATQSMEVMFALIGEIVILSAPLPATLSWLGMLIIMIGMILHSYVSHSPTDEGRFRRGQLLAEQAKDEAVR